MRLAPPSTTLIPNTDNVRHVVECASICYHSTPINTQRMYDRLIRDGHISMLRHETHYYKIPEYAISSFYWQYFKSNPYCHILYIEDGYYYLSTNGNWLYDNKDTIADYMNLPQFEVSYREFYERKELHPIVRLTFAIDTQIAITRELNRVSPNNISERSTRYIDFVKKLGIVFSVPHWWKNLGIYRHVLANIMLRISEKMYRVARSKYGLNLKAEDARYFLPLGVESRVAYTYTIEEWQHIIDLRVKGTTGKPHPDAKEAISHIRDYIIKFNEHCL